MDEISRFFQGDTDNAPISYKTINTVVIKLQLKSECHEEWKRALESRIKLIDNFDILRSTSHDNEYHFLQIFDASSRANDESDGILSTSKEITKLQDKLFSLQVPDLENFDPERSFISQLKQEKVIVDIFPMHLKHDKRILNKTWVQSIFRQQPLNVINSYFGSEIAAYFAWLGFYTTSLLLPAIIGILQEVHRYYYPHERFTFFSIIAMFVNFIWVSLFLQSWSTINGTIQRNWTKMDCMKNVHRLDYKLGGMIHQRIKQAFSLVITLLLLGILLATTDVILHFDKALTTTMTKNETLPDETNQNETLNIEHDNWDIIYPMIPEIVKSSILLLPQIFLTLVLISFNMFYTTLAEYLTRWENYKQTDSQNNALMAKLICFRIFNAYHSLFYVAFVLKDQARLEERLVSLLIVQQIRSNIREVFGASLRVRILQVIISLVACSLLTDGFIFTTSKIVTACVVAVSVHYASGALKGKRFVKWAVFQKVQIRGNLSLVDKESRKLRYNSTYLDFLEMLIQFGYIFMFSSAYPLAGVFAFVSNIVEIHTDAFKLINMCQRPFPSYHTNTKFWEYGFGLMMLVGVLTNSELIRQSSVFGDVHIPFVRCTFLCLVAFVLVHFIVKSFLVGVFSKVRIEETR